MEDKIIQFIDDIKIGYLEDFSEIVKEYDRRIHTDNYESITKWLLEIILAHHKELLEVEAKINVLKSMIK